jgi:hypothetical protein
MFASPPESAPSSIVGCVVVLRVTCPVRDGVKGHFFNQRSPRTLVALVAILQLNVKIRVVTVQKRAKTCCDWVYEILAIVEPFIVTTRPGRRRPHQFGDRLARELCFGGPVYSKSKRATTRTPRICKDQRRLQNCPFAGYKNLPSMLRNQLTGEAQSSPPTSRATGAFGQPPLRKVEDPYRLLFLFPTHPRGIARPAFGGLGHVGSDSLSRDFEGLY